jgi:hypothetical protein
VAKPGARDLDLEDLAAMSDDEIAYPMVNEAADF